MKRVLSILLLLTASLAQAAPPKLPFTTATYVNKTIAGKAAIHDYPWDYAHSNGVKPDIHGPDTPQVADGLILDGSAPRGAQLELKNIAGTALTLKGTAIGRLGDVNVHTAINGVRVDATDAQLDHVNVDNIVKDSITVAGGGNDFIDVSHVCGGDRGFVFLSRILGRGLFADNERIGCTFTGDSHGSYVDGFTLLGCWERGIVLDANGVTISKLNGTTGDANHSGTIGVQFLPGVCHETVSGWLFVAENSIGLNVTGDRNEVDLTGGGWNVKQDASTYLKLYGHITKSTFKVRAYCNGGTVIDTNAANLDETDTIEAWVDGPIEVDEDGMGRLNCRTIFGDTGKATVIIHEVKK